MNITDGMLEIALDIIMPQIQGGTFDSGDLREALEKAIAAMPPIKLLKAKFKTAEEIEAQQYSDYWRGIIDGTDSAKASIEAAGLRWIE